MVDRRETHPVCLIDGGIFGNHRHDLSTERLEDAGPIVLVGNLVGDHHDSSLTLFLGNGYSPSSYVDGAKRWLDHHDRRIDGFGFEASQRADASFEVGDDGRGLVIH